MDLISERDAAKMCGVAVITMRVWRLDGYRSEAFEPPPFYRFGRMIKYSREELKHWITKHRVERQRTGS